jgi:shikimate dehydrogenase
MNENFQPKACVIGWPVEHSRSPLIHSFWLEQLGIPGSYERAPVSKDEFAGFFGRLSDLGFVGANVTLPFKEQAFELCDQRTETALQLGAVNTLWIEAGRTFGDNTDVAGFLGALDQEAPGWDKQSRHAIVLGAGGAARAVIFGLLLRNMERISIVNRTESRGLELMRFFDSDSVHTLASHSQIEVCAWPESPNLLAQADLLVNATSLGMQGQPELEIDLSPLPAHAIVDDIVYVPLVTPLLGRAQARGLRTVGGLGMLLHQAVPGFEKWFGQKPVVTDELRARLEADIKRAA